ncbi:MAG: 30S ribosomal protein S27e [Candidatus Micrarchaeota archaeon]|nr:30S ribosomal protein S27e [Candidatus Micrarchaeota archaeon]
MESKYLKVKCKCGNEQTVFSHTTQIVNCSSCNEPLAHPSGGVAIIHGDIVEELG